jgi:hypothetical protein
MKTPGSRQIGSGLGVWGERELPLRTGSEETELSRTFRRFPAHLARLSTKGARNASALPFRRQNRSCTGSLLKLQKSPRATAACSYWWDYTPYRFSETKSMTE